MNDNDRVLDLPTPGGEPTPMHKPDADAWKLNGGPIQDPRLSDWAVRHTYKHAINGASGSNEILGEMLIIVLERR